MVWWLSRVIVTSDLAKDRSTVSSPRRSYHHGNLREALLEAGLELTRTGGPSALAVRDVTRRVGVSPNAAYRHFADRDSLGEAIAEQIRQNMADRMHAYQTDGGNLTGRDLLRAVGLGYIEFAVSEPGWFEVAFSEIPPIDPSAGQQLPVPLMLLVSALDRAVATGELSADDRQGAEWPCWSAVHGFALLTLHGPLRNQPRQQLMAAAERTVDAIVTGVLDAGQ